MSTRVRSRLPLGPLTLVLPACAVAGSCLAIWPFATALVILVLSALTVLSTTAYPVMIGFLLFVLFQDPIQVLAGGDSALGIAVKRADEPLLLGLGVVYFLLNRSIHAALGYRKIGVAVVVCFAGLLLSSIPPVGWLPAGVDLALFAKPFLLFILGLSVSIGTNELRERLDTVLLTMVACIAFGIVFLLMPQLQDAYVGDLRPPDERLGFLSAQGFFLGPGTFSWFAAATFAISYSAYIYFKRSFYLVASFTCATFVVLSWRRKSILAVMAMILVSLLVRGTKGSRSRAIAVLAVTIALAVMLVAPHVGALWSQTVQEYGTEDPYGSARAALYYTSLLIARDHFPLGTGLATFASHASKLFYSDVYRVYGLSNMYGLSPEYPEYITDTFWPMVLGEGGVVCFTGYAAFFFLLVRTMWRAARSRRDDPVSAFLVTATLLLLVGSLLESTASHLYGSSLQAALVLIPAGIAWRHEAEHAGRHGGIPT